MKIIVPIFFAVVFSGCHRFRSTDEQLIRRARISSNDAIAAHDTARLASFWARDLCVVTSRNNQNTGRTENAKAFQTEFNSKEHLIYIRTTTQVELFPEWNMAAEHGVWVGRWEKEGSSVEVKGSYYAKWKKENDRWLISAEVYTPVSCKGDPYCLLIP